MDIELPYSLEALIVVGSSAHGPEGHLGLPSTGAAGPAHDHLRSPRTAAEWLRARRELTCPAGEPSVAELRLLRGVRAALRELVAGEAPRYRRRIERLLRAYAYRLDGRRLVPLETGWRRFAAGLLPALVEAEAHRAALRFCANPRCRWIFLDRSGSRARRWCDMSACGNRFKARRFRARRRAGQKSRRG